MARTGARRLNQTEKEQRVYEMRKRGLTLDQICKTPDPDTGAPLYASRGGAFKAICRVIERNRESEAAMVEAARFMASERLEQLYQETMAILARPVPLLDRRGAVVMRPVERNGREVMVPVDDPMPKLAAIREAVRIEDRMAKLHGWDAAQKHVHTGPGGGPIEVEARVAEMRVELQERLGALQLLPAAVEGEQRTGTAV